MIHTHQHKAPLGAPESVNAVFYWAIGLNMLYVIIEAAFGFYTGSMGLLSDAGHNLSDVASLVVAFVALKVSQRRPTVAYSYGFGRATIGASLVNAVILYVAVIFIAWESIERLLHPAPVDGDTIAIVAGAGVVINGLTAWMLLRHSHDDLNVRGAFLHMAADALVSVGVVVSGIAIRMWGLEWIDPVVGIAIAIIIAVGAWSLLRDSLRLALDGVPSSIDTTAVGRAIAAVPQVLSYHHLHIRALSTTATSLTVHVLVASPADVDAAIAGVRGTLARMGIHHSTIEAETTTHSCGTSGMD